MGRYYTGDIEGKFWFGVQSSNDADFFGSYGYEPSYLNYYFDENNLKDIEKGIASCKKKLGKYKKLLDDFFKEKESYNNEMIVQSLEISKEKVKVLLEWYARLSLGEKIYECVKKSGSCEFEAEL